MSPRLPPESPDDDEQSELLQAVHNALNDLAPLTDPTDEQPLADALHGAQPLEVPDETEVEIDRIEAYLRGPTAFTACPQTPALSASRHRCMLLIATSALVMAAADGAEISQ